MSVVGSIDMISETTGQALLDAELHRNALLQVLAADNITAITGDFKNIQRLVKAGLASKIFDIGDQLVTTWTDVATEQEYEFPFDIVHFGDVELEDGEVVPGMFLQLHYATPLTMPFDYYEALYYATEELPAGTYNFTIVTTWSNATAGTYQFTLTEPVPVGGQIRGLTKIADTAPSAWTVSTYLSQESTTAIETVSVTEGSDGTSLGNLIPAGSDNLNSIQRVGYGYNRWSQSAYRQWLNSDAAKGAWWSAQNNFDVPPTQAATKAGFLTGFESDFLDVVGTVKVTTALNTVTDSSIGTSEDTYDKFFLPSLEQNYIVPELSDVEGDYFEYWKRATGATSPQVRNVAYPERITYAVENHSSAQNVRLRSARRGTACIVWFVYSTGNVYNYNAYNELRCTPVCVIC